MKLPVTCAMCTRDGVLVDDDRGELVVLHPDFGTGCHLPPRVPTPEFEREKPGNKYPSPYDKGTRWMSLGRRR